MVVYILAHELFHCQLSTQAAAYPRSAKMTTEHKAVLVSGFNKQHMTDVCSACSLGTRNTATPGPGEALIRVLCRPIHPVDILFIQGGAWQPKSFPSVPGFEGMGIVQQVGKNVSNVQVGQRVHVSNETGQGSWQEYVVGPSIFYTPIPDSITDEAACQYFGNPWTVYGMFDELKPPKGEYVLQTAAASVLGRMFIQYAHYHGVKTINLVRRNEQKEELKSLGADEVINYVEEDVVEKVKEITRGKLAFGAIECIGGEITKLVASCVSNGATVLNYGVLGATHVEVDSRDLLFREVKVIGFNLFLWIKRLTPAEKMKVGEEVMGLLAKRILQPLSGEKFPLKNFKEAIAKAQESARGGKVLLVSY